MFCRWKSTVLGARCRWPRRPGLSRRPRCAKHVDLAIGQVGRPSPPHGPTLVSGGSEDTVDSGWLKLVVAGHRRSSAAAWSGSRRAVAPAPVASRRKRRLSPADRPQAIAPRRACRGGIRGRRRVHGASPRPGRLERVSELARAVAPSSTDEGDSLPLRVIQTAGLIQMARSRSPARSCARAATRSIKHSAWIELQALRRTHRQRLHRRRVAAR